MKKLIMSVLGLLMWSNCFAYNVDPTTRTHVNNADIEWNVLDILDDYINFDYLNGNLDFRQQMYNELAAYLNTLDGVSIDFVDPKTNATPSHS